jgi:hypothetical protein
MTIFWQASTMSGVKCFDSIGECAGWVGQFLLANPTATVAPMERTA